MTFLNLLFALIAKFVPIETAKRQQLELDAESWYKKLDEENTPQWLKMLKAHGETWYVQVGCAIAFIFLQRIIFDFLNPSDEEPDELD